MLDNKTAMIRIKIGWNLTCFKKVNRWLGLESDNFETVILGFFSFMDNSSEVSACDLPEFLLREYLKHKLQIKSSLYSRYYAEACNEWRGPLPRLTNTIQKKRRSDGEPLATLCLI